MTLELGSQPIDFNLLGTDDQRYSLDSFKESNLLAIIFSCNHCPYVVASEREFKELQSEYGPKGLQLVAINSNSANPDYPGDSFDNMKKRAEEKEFNFPYLDDHDQGLARKYGAGRTPEIYLYDENRSLVYHGRINDNPTKHDQITRHDLREAIDELLEGKSVSVDKVPAIGCSIKFVN
ncbi:MAG: thioredoxin family protein [Candidatus Kariarchaeaceae archaeon]|jgi:peroxiredoxin